MSDQAFKRWKSYRAADQAAAQENGWVRYWDGWPMCAVCYEARLASRGETRADLRGALNTTPTDRLKAGDKCIKCKAVFPDNSRPWQ